VIRARSIRAVTAVAAGLVALTLAPSVVRAGGCRDEPRAGCDARPECRWLDARERADGTTIEARCVNRPPSAEALSKRLEKAMPAGGLRADDASAARDEAVKKRREARKRAMEKRRQTGQEPRSQREPKPASEVEDD
jgi:hypothetical protein